MKHVSYSSTDRRRLLMRRHLLDRSGTTAEDATRRLEAGGRAALAVAPQASGAELRPIEPRLRARIPARLPSETPQTATRAALSRPSIVDVDLDGMEGVDLASREDGGVDVPDSQPTAAAIEAAAGRLEERLAGAVVTPAIRTPLERTLSS